MNCTRKLRRFNIRTYPYSTQGCAILDFVARASCIAGPLTMPAERLGHVLHLHNLQYRAPSKHAQDPKRAPLQNAWPAPVKIRPCSVIGLATASKEAPTLPRFSAPLRPTPQNAALAMSGKSGLVAGSASTLKRLHMSVSVQSPQRTGQAADRCAHASPPANPIIKGGLTTATRGRLAKDVLPPRPTYQLFSA